MDRGLYLEKTIHFCSNCFNEVLLEDKTEGTFKICTNCGYEEYLRPSLIFKWKNRREVSE